MTADQKAKQAVNFATTWLRYGILVVLLIVLAATLASILGFRFLPRPVAPTDLAYLAGCYWLLKG